jgi:membrane-associated protease RseP (regulator of RpoE activity)
LTNASPGLLMTILSFLLVIGPLIFIHELGHYFAGRWFGVKAETFSIGFGREIAAGPTSAAPGGRSAGCRSAAT